MTWGPREFLRLTGRAMTLIGVYHQLFRIEKSFRMANSDLQPRPIYDRTRDSIEAYLTIVFAARPVSRWIEHQTGRSIRKFVKTARRYRTVQIQAGPHTTTPRITSVLTGLAAPPAAGRLLLTGSPRFAEVGIDLTSCRGHELGDFSPGSLQLRINRRALPARRRSVKPRTRSGGDVGGHALNVSLSQLARGTRADEPGLLTRLACELHHDALSRDADSSDLRRWRAVRRRHAHQAPIRFRGLQGLHPRTGRQHPPRKPTAPPTPHGRPGGIDLRRPPPGH
jgi:hypothetical protein